MKFVARRMGMYAIYRAWYLGLLIALAIALATRGSFIFAAPGAVEVCTTWRDPRAELAIALAGPGTNLAIALTCLAIQRLLTELPPPLHSLRRARQRLPSVLQLASGTTPRRIQSP